MGTACARGRALAVRCSRTSLLSSLFLFSLLFFWLFPLLCLLWCVLCLFAFSSVFVLLRLSCFSLLSSYSSVFTPFNWFRFVPILPLALFVNTFRIYSLSSS